MARDKTLRGYLGEFIVIFAGVALAFGVENLRESLNERAVGAQYLVGFRQDLLADSEMLQTQLEIRRAQVENAATVIEFADGRPLDVPQFLDAFWAVLPAHSTAPNRNTMDEVLNSGSLRLIDGKVRSALLDLYATYGRIDALESHIARDFDQYLYDPTFSSIPFQFEGPWDSPTHGRAVETLLADLTILNGIRLVIANLEVPGGLLEELELVLSQVDGLLNTIG